MKKLAKKLIKIDIKLPKWTREILYDHLMEICENLKEHNKFMKKYPINIKNY